MQEKSKTASYSEPIQILTLVPDKWSRIYCSEYFNVFEYLVWTSHEIKKVGGILAKPAPKKGKTITTELLHLITNVYEDINFSRLVLEKKDYINVSKGVHKQKLCNLQKLYTAFKKNTQILILGSHSVCVCSAHEHVVLLVDAVDWDLIKLTLSYLMYFN